MAEMVECATVLHNATSNSLVVLDELGRGTSTSDGFGIAWGVAQYLWTNIGCTTLMATHFHEMTALARDGSAAVNLHVTAVVSGTASTRYRCL